MGKKAWFGFSLSTPWKTREKVFFPVWPVVVTGRGFYSAVFPPEQIFIHRNIAKYVAVQHSLISAAHGYRRVVGCIFNNCYPSVYHGMIIIPPLHLRTVEGETDCYFLANSISQTTMPCPFSHTELLESRVTQSKRSASSAIPIVLESQLAIKRSEATRTSLRIRYFGHGLGPLGSLLRCARMTPRRRTSWQWEMYGCRCRTLRRSWADWEDCPRCRWMGTYITSLMVNWS